MTEANARITTPTEDLITDNPDAVITENFKKAVAERGLARIVQATATDLRHGHYHDWRVYCLIIDAVAREAAFPTPEEAG